MIAKAPRSRKKNAELARQAQLEIDNEDYRRAETERFIKESLPAEGYQNEEFLKLSLAAI